MESTFTFSTSEFKKMISEVRKLSKRSIKVNIQISVEPDRLEFQFIGMSRFITAETSNYCDVVIPFQLLDNIAKAEKTAQMTWVVKDGEIGVGKVVVKNEAIQVQSLFVNPPIQLAMNQDSLSLLRLRHTHTEAKLIELKLLEYVEQEEAKLEVNMKAAAKILKAYGITIQMLRALVAKNI